MSETPASLDALSSDTAMSSTLGVSEQLPVTHGNPGLERAGKRIRLVTLLLGVAVVMGVVVWMFTSEASARYLTGGWAVGAVVAMTVFSVFVLRRVFQSPQASLPGWLGLGYLGRILIVAVALIGGRFAGAEVRVIGVALIVTILLSTLAEVWLLSRARILNVVPLATSD